MSKVIKPTDQSNTSTYEIIHGATISIESHHVLAYAYKRSAQLSAILELESLAADCEHSTASEQTLTNFRWLATSLATEVMVLLDLAVEREASNV